MERKWFSPCAQLEDELADLDFRRGSKPGSSSKTSVRVVHQRARQAEALFHAAGQLVDHILTMAEVDKLQEVSDDAGTAYLRIP